jgi:hypothetical protein
MSLVHPVSTHVPFPSLFLDRISNSTSRGPVVSGQTYVGVEQTQDELEVRLLSGDERHLCGRRRCRGFVGRSLVVSRLASLSKFAKAAGSGSEFRLGVVCAGLFSDGKCGIARASLLATSPSPVCSKTFNIRLITEYTTFIDFFYTCLVHVANGYQVTRLGEHVCIIHSVHVSTVPSLDQS